MATVVLLCFVAAFAAVAGLASTGLALTAAAGLAGAALFAAPAFGLVSVITGLTAAVLVLRRQSRLT